MASAGWKTGKRRTRGGLVAAYGLVIGLVIGSAVMALGIGAGAPEAAQPPEVSTDTALPPPRTGSLKLPPRPPASHFRTLAPIEAAGMVETTGDGLRLPRISPAGWVPWLANARRFDPLGPPARMGLLMIELGASEPLMLRAIDEMPGEVSLAFLPGTPDLPRWLKRAREYGHETYLMLPVEDPTGLAERRIKPISAAADQAENLRRLHSAMARGEGYGGFVVRSPGLLSQSEPLARPLIKEIADRGLAVIELNPSPDTALLRSLTVEFGTGYARSTNILDYKLTADGVADALDRLAAWVGDSGTDRAPRHAFAVLQPTAEAIEAVAVWYGQRKTPANASLVPIIGHFECRHACMTRLGTQPAQLRP